MTTPELKPCPFCGEAAALEQIGNRRQSTIVACTNCGARHECGEEWGHGTAWNTRADISQAAIAAAMQGAVKLADGIAGNTKDYQADYRRAAGQIGALIKASIPTDAMAALEAVKAAVLEEVATEMDTAAHIASLCGSGIKVRMYQNVAAAIRAMKGGDQ